MRKTDKETAVALYRQKPRKLFLLENYASSFESHLISYVDPLRRISSENHEGGSSEYFYPLPAVADISGRVFLLETIGNTNEWEGSLKKLSERYWSSVKDSSFSLEVADISGKVFLLETIGNTNEREGLLKKLSERCWSFVKDSSFPAKSDYFLERIQDDHVKCLNERCDRLIRAIGKDLMYDIDLLSEKRPDSDELLGLLNNLFGYLIYLVDEDLPLNMKYFLEIKEGQKAKIGFIIKRRGTLRAILETPNKISYTWVIKSKYKGMPCKQGVFYFRKAPENSIYIRDLLREVF